MALDDLGEPGFDVPEGVRFRALRPDGTSLMVLVTLDALRDVAKSSEQSVASFDEYRGVFGEIASDKYDRYGLEGDGQLWVRSADLGPGKP